MRNLLLKIKRKAGKRIRRIFAQTIRAYDEWKYSHYKPGHIFNISVDDLNFKMTFNEYPLNFPIVERIEGRREPVLVALIKSLVKKDSQVLEIGGCYGYFTTIMSFCAGENGKIVSIEGTPNNFNILKDNVRLNARNNIEVHNIFVGRESSQIHFHKSDRAPYEAIKRFKENISADTGKVVTVPVKKVSQFLDEIKFRPDVIFMDIEGFEAEVLEDLAENYFRLFSPVIVFEVHPSFYAKDKGIEFIQGLLKRHNYYYNQAGTNCICFPEQRFP